MEMNICPNASVKLCLRGSLRALESADYIYIYTNALKHSQYYRAMNLVKDTGKMIFYLHSSNSNENLRRFYRDLSSRV